MQVYASIKNAIINVFKIKFTTNLIKFGQIYDELISYIWINFYQICIIKHVLSVKSLQVFYASKFIKEVLSIQRWTWIVLIVNFGNFNRTKNCCHKKKTNCSLRYPNLTVSFRIGHLKICFLRVISGRDFSSQFTDIRTDDYF